MGTKGLRKFICLDCGKGTFFNKKEMNSRSRIRCSNCGSPALDPAKKSKVKTEIMEQNENRNIPQSGSFLRAEHKISGDK